MRCLCRLVAIALCFQRADAATWFVAPSGHDGSADTSWAMAKPPIQAAINVAEPSHRVLVSTGGCETGGRVASGLARINRVVINKPIAMQSANRRR
jgi:hypothetical protein